MDGGHWGNFERMENKMANYRDNRAMVVPRNF